MSLPDDILNTCRFEDDPKLLSEYAVDASLFEVEPQSVAYPKNLHELKELVKAVVKNGSVTLSARGGGTCMSGGSLTEGVMVDMKEGFGEVGEVDEENRTIWVGSGAYYRDIEKKTLEKGLIFPAYTSSKDFCCIGGMVGNNASGEKSLRYGATVDNVDALKMVCSDGEEYLFQEVTHEQLQSKIAEENFEGILYKGLYELISTNSELIENTKPKVKKNAAGYGLWNVYNPEKKTWNLAKIIIGSQGTFGLVTEVNLRLIPAPKYTRMVVLPVNGLAHLADGVEEILNHKPEGLETYDNHTYELALQYLPKEAEAARRSKGANLVLFAQFVEESEEETEHKAQKCVDDLRMKDFDAVLVHDEEEIQAHWMIRRMSYKLLKDHAPTGFIAAPFIEDTIVPIGKYGEFLSEWEKILADYHMTYTFAGHIGDGSIRLIPLVETGKYDSVDHIFDLARRSYELVVTYGGSISVDHNDGLIRTPFLSLMFKPEVLKLFQKTKSLFDPKGMFNPNKKVGGDIEFSKAHVKEKLSHY